MRQRKSKKRQAQDRTHYDVLVGAHAIKACAKAKRRKIQFLTGNLKKLPNDLVSRYESKVLGKQNLRQLVHQSLSSQILEAGSDLRQEVFARVSPYTYTPVDDLLACDSERSLVIFCDRIQDPHNLGAMIRTAHALGVEGMVLSTHESARINATVAKASAGASEHLNVAKVSNLAMAVRAFQDGGYQIIASCVPGDAQENDLNLLRPEEIQRKKTALILGNEQKGIRPKILKQVDAGVMIPMHDDFDSLNVSVTAGILMYVLSQTP